MMKKPTAERLPSGRWRARIQIDGERYSATEDTKKEAQDAVLRKVVLRLETKKKSGLTVGDAMDSYILEHRVVLSPSTVQGYKVIRKNYLQDLMDVKLDDLDQSDIQLSVSEMAADGKSPKTIANIPIRADVWTKQYCPIAIDLANQGFIVMTSCHKPVIEYFMSAIYPKNVSGAVIFAPDRRYKKEWIDRLSDRYNKTELQKDERALTRAIKYFDEDIAFLNNCGLPIYTPATLDYDLKDYINYIVAKKEN